MLRNAAVSSAYRVGSYAIPPRAASVLMTFLLPRVGKVGTVHTKGKNTQLVPTTMESVQRFSLEGSDGDSSNPPRVPVLSPSASEVGFLVRPPSEIHLSHFLPNPEE